MSVPPSSMYSHDSSIQKKSVNWKVEKVLLVLKVGIFLLYIPAKHSPHFHHNCLAPLISSGCSWLLWNYVATQRRHHWPRHSVQSSGTDSRSESWAGRPVVGQLMTWYDRLPGKIPNDWNLPAHPHHWFQQDSHLLWRSTMEQRCKWIRHARWHFKCKKASIFNLLCRVPIHAVGRDLVAAPANRDPEGVWTVCCGRARQEDCGE